MLVIYFLSFIQTQCNVACVDSPCSACISGSLYNSISCLPLCPTGYTQSDNSCSPTDGLTIFSLDFSEFTSFSSTNIGDFLAPSDLPFSNPASMGPLPTSNQGLYFTSSSCLEAQRPGWVLAPDFTLSFLYNPTSDGIILQVYDGSILVLSLSVHSGSINLSLILANSLNQNSVQTAGSAVSPGWFSFSLTGSQGNGVFTITALGNSATFNGYEFRYQVDTLSYYIGNGVDGFQGFLYFIRLDNEAISGFTGILPVYGEIFQGYTDSGFNPQVCSISCPSQWPWCIRASCSICYSDNCYGCSGYSLDECTSCVNNDYSAPECGLLGLHCQSGGLFSCSTCMSGFSLIDGLCLNSPFNYNPENLSNPVVDLKFDSYMQYYEGIFYSGAIAATYSPFNPSPDDPIFLKSRGLYFYGGAYLTSLVAIVSNYKFTITAWVLAKNNGEIYNKNSIILYSSSCAGLYLSSAQSVKWVSSGICLSEYGVWTFDQLTVGFSSGTTQITISINQVVSTLVSFNGYALYDDFTSLSTIGSGLYGFIYSLSIWQSDSVLTANHYNVCGNDLSASCLWTCLQGNYWNPYTQTCQNCFFMCVHGCGTWGTCNPCADISCSTCTNYNATCVPDLTSGQCGILYYFKEPGKCCRPNCADCYESYTTNCLACYADKYLLGDHCVEICPLGFTASGGNCVITIDPIIVLSFDEIQSEVIDSASGLVFQSASAGTSPLPTAQRGYYFSHSSVLTSESFVLSFNFTIIFYIKLQSAGNLYDAGGFFIEYTAGTIVIQFFENGYSYYLNTVSFPNIDEWIVLAVSSYQGFGNQETMTRVQHSANSATFVNSYFTELVSCTDTVIDIGSSSSSFTGFLWFFQVWNSMVDVSTLFIQTCFTSGSSDCLWPCDFNEYFEGPSCITCGGSCPNSVCRRESDCSLCVNILCTACLDFTTCTSCIANAQLNSQSVCECSTGYYWATASQTCEECDPLCTSCTGPGLSECYCGDNAYLEGYQCVCNTGYYSSDSGCLACDFRCLECFGPKYYECLECSRYLFETVCLQKCPVGYFTLGNQCMIESLDYLVVRYAFDTPMTTVRDQMQGLIAIYGSYNNKYPYLDASDPIPAYQRGIYFTGTGSFLTFPHSSEDILLFGHRFSIAIWINPISPSNTLLFYENPNSQLLFSLTISNFFPEIIVLIDISYYNYSAINPLQPGEWNHILFSLGYTNFTTVEFYVNTYQTQSAYLENAPFIDSKNSLMILGTDRLFLEFFSGFVYSIELYINLPVLSSLADIENCNTCLVCPATGLCIPDCNISSYYNNSSNQCVECRSDCLYGCSNNQNCSLCLDPYCSTCTCFTTDSCIECVTNYQIVNNICVPCDSSTYYDEQQKTCRECLNLCKECTSATACTSCSENSHLVSNTACGCNLGYFFNNSMCARKSFFASISISSKNVAVISFTEDLKENLESNALQVQINQVPQIYSIQMLDNSLYSVSVSFSSSINPGDKLQINFISPILSKANSILATTALEVELFTEYSYKDILVINQAASIAQFAFVAGVGAAFATSLLNVNPLTFFNFLNNMDIYSYTALYYQDLDPSLVKFLQILNPSSWVPNIFSYFINQSEGNQLDPSFNNYGNSSNLLLINSGSTLGILAGILGIPFIAAIVKNIKISWIRRQSIKILNNYRFKAFLRFFLQSFLELSCNAIIGIYYTSLRNTTQLIDFIFSLIFGVFTI